MNKPPYFGRSLLWMLLLLPILFQVSTVGFFFLGYLLSEIAGTAAGLIIAGSVIGFVFIGGCVHRGRCAIRKSFSPSPSDSATESDLAYDERCFGMRYLPVIVAFGYTLIVGLVSLLLPIPPDGSLFGAFLSVFTVAHMTSSPVIGIATMMGPPSPWFYLVPPLLIYAAYGAGLAWGFREQRIPRTHPRGQFIFLAVLALFIGAMAWRADFMTRGVIRGNRDTWYTEKMFNQHYHPFRSDNRLVRIPDPTLAIGRNHPRLDGATAAYPIYAAAVQAIYKNVDANRAQELVTSSTTPEAYSRLISGETDLIFVAQPSPEQRAAAEAAGHRLQLTPIAKEAFVFFVHAGNPVDGLTSDQIRAIYTKKIVNWKEVGGRDEPIIPFQRPQGSGSQTALEIKVMKGEKPATPLREEFAEGMGGVVQRVAAYQNSSGAIGYSFRVFATTLTPEKEIKFLKVDGIAPTRETIRSAVYPYTVDVYAATAGTTNLHVAELLAWFLSPQGQHLIDETGYVSLPPAH